MGEVNNDNEPHAPEEQPSALKNEHDAAKSPSVAAAATQQNSSCALSDDNRSSTSSLKRNHSTMMQSASSDTPAARVASRLTNTVVKDLEYSAQTQDVYCSSCVVELPAGAEAGDQLLIRWPRRDDSINDSARLGEKVKSETDVACLDDKDELEEEEPIQGASKFRRTMDTFGGDNLSPHKSSRDGGLLVRITLPSKLSVKRKRKGSPGYIKVLAPWKSAERAASNTLNTKQLQSVGIDGHSACNSNLQRKRRQERKKNHGEGNVVKRTMSRVGRQYQVHKSDLPSSDTWEKERALQQELMCREQVVAAADLPQEREHNREQDSRTAECVQIWSRSLAETAASRGENIYHYINSLKPYQKAHGMMTLHQCNYKISTAEEMMNGSSNKDGEATTSTQHHNTISLLEGTPLTQNERTTFNDAMDEHDKQWPKIAKAVGTTPGRCLIHYYSQYKCGEERERYLEKKKQWEQSDYCEICDDGGDLLCCDGCPVAYHKDCIQLRDIPEGSWYCPECNAKRNVTEEYHELPPVSSGNSP